MLFSIKRIFYLLLIVSLYQSLQAQTARSVEKQKKYQNLQVVDGKTHYEFRVLSISKKHPSINITYTWYANNVINSTQGNYSGKLLHGSCSQFSNKTNMLITKGNYKFGQKRGKWLEWNTDGKLKTNKTYKHGRKQGWTIQYDESGTITEKNHYAKDVLQGRSYKYIKGIKQEPVIYKEGVVIEGKPIKAIFKKLAEIKHKCSEKRKQKKLLKKKVIEENVNQSPVENKKEVKEKKKKSPKEKEVSSEQKQPKKLKKGKEIDTSK